jgi:CheY-like chemotaxis protein
MRRLNCVLLVDDDKVNNYLNEKLIRKLDLAKNVKIALDGEEALLYLSKHSSPYDYNYPDLILLDYNMPQMQGNEFLQFFNNINSNQRHKSKIVVLTASVNPAIRQELEELGVVAYLEKPLTREKLIPILEVEEQKHI